jgi:hypothetical protein
MEHLSRWVRRHSRDAGARNRVFAMKDFPVVGRTPSESGVLSAAGSIICGRQCPEISDISLPSKFLTVRKKGDRVPPRNWFNDQTSAPCSIAPKLPGFTHVVCKSPRFCSEVKL